MTWLFLGDADKSKGAHVWVFWARGELRVPLTLQFLSAPFWVRHSVRDHILEIAFRRRVGRGAGLSQGKDWNLGFSPYLQCDAFGFKWS